MPEPNAQQAELWDGESGARWVAEQVAHDRMLLSFGLAALDAAAITSADDVLDIGCGTGAMTREAARRAARGSALGVDLSSAMLRLARELAMEEGLAHCLFEQADAQVHGFTPASVDAVLSRFGVMFFDDPVAAFANIRTAMRDGARLAFACWMPLADNPWLSVPRAAIASVVDLPAALDPDAPGPFAFADADRVRGILDAAGFDAIELTPHRAAINMGADLDEALELLRGTTIVRTALAGQPVEVVERAEPALVEALRPYATPGGVELPGAAWVVTASPVVATGM